MIEEVSLTNFKAFKELDCLELRPLTVLCGPNAAGKSSVIQSLLLLKQNVSLLPPSHEGVVLSGPLISFGSHETITRNLKKPISFSWTLYVADAGFAYLRSQLECLLGKVRSIGGLEFLSEAPVMVELSVVLGEPGSAGDFRGGTGGSTQVKQLSLSLHGCGANVMSEESPRFRILLQRQARRWTVDYQESMGLGWTQSQFTARIKTNGFVPVIESIARSVNDADSGETESMFSPLGLPDEDREHWLAMSVLDAIMRALGIELSRSRYLGPLRDRPRRVYPSDADVFPEDGTGADAVSALYNNLDSYARLTPGVAEAIAIDGTHESPFRPPPSREQPLANYLVAVRHWLGRMGFPGLDIDELQPRDDIWDTWEYGYRVRFAGGINIADTGFGLSQVFPVVVQGLSLENDELLLEQPEIHLHPRLQTELADFMIHTVTASPKRIVVETHSDHLVNRLVRRIIEGKISADKVAIYFFTPTSDGPHIEEIEIDPLFGIRNWPMGFFDQYVDEQEAIIRASLARRAEEDRN